MNITEFLESKQVKLEELEENFELTERIDIDMMTHEKECICCGDKNNQYKMPSEPWTSVIHCTACSSLLLIMFADRMSGNYKDTILIYREK